MSQGRKIENSSHLQFSRSRPSPRTTDSQTDKQADKQAMEAIDTGPEQVSRLDRGIRVGAEDGVDSPMSSEGIADTTVDVGSRK